MKVVDGLGKTVERTRDPGRPKKIEGKHSTACARKKHEDWQHGMGEVGCVVDERGVRCDCTAHWVEVRTSGTKLGQ